MVEKVQDSIETNTVSKSLQNIQLLDIGHSKQNPHVLAKQLYSRNRIGPNTGWNCGAK